MKRKIITDITYIKQKSKEVFLRESIQIIKDLEDSLEGQRGIGLSAIQIGIPKRVAIIRIINKEPINLINPKIIEKEERARVKDEGCLSIPGIYIDTTRYYKIILENGNGEKTVLHGLEAIAVQHEIDHMNGITILNRKKRKGK